MTNNNKGDIKVEELTRKLTVDDNYYRMWYKNEVWIVKNNMTYHDVMIHLLKNNGVWYVLNKKYNKQINLCNVNKFEEIVSDGKGRCKITKHDIVV